MFRRLLFQRPSAAVAAAAGRLLHTAGAPLCAGHSKWANIRHIKALKDGQRSLQFIKLARQIRIAVQEGGGSVNPATNGQLRQAIDEATKRDMPNHTIQGVLRKAAATQAVPSKLKRFVIEARVLNKIFMVLVLYTDKYAGDRMQIATLFRKGGAVAMDVRHMFEEKGFVEATLDATAAAAPGADAAPLGEEQLTERCTEDAIECGAEECEVLDAQQRRILFICDPEELDRLRQKLTAVGYAIDSFEHAFIPNSHVQLSDAELAAYRHMRDKLKAFEGIEDIYDNVPDDGELDAQPEQQQQKQKR